MYIEETCPKCHLQTTSAFDLDGRIFRIWHTTNGALCQRWAPALAQSATWPDSYDTKLAAYEKHVFPGQWHPWVEMMRASLGSDPDVAERAHAAWVAACGPADYTPTPVVKPPAMAFPAYEAIVLAGLGLWAEVFTEGEDDVAIEIRDLWENDVPPDEAIAEIACMFDIPLVEVTHVDR